jgi:3-hydroxyisobutyrate dehydrogenase
MKTGFIGLGNLGTAMAKRLISEGIELTVWNRTRGKAVGLGADIAESPASLASSVDILFLNLFDSDAVRSVLLGDGGVLKGDCKGTIIIDTTTNHFGSVLEFHTLTADAGASYLEAPVLGSVVPASQGNLTVLVSGSKTAYEKSVPILEKVGRNIFFMEEPSIATKMKLVNNMVLGVLMATLAEAVVLGERIGLERSQVLDVLGAGAGNSLVLNAKKEKIRNGDFSAHFSSLLIYKDLHYLQDLARTLKTPLFTGSSAKELFAMTFPRGEEGLDFSAVYNVFESL